MPKLAGMDPSEIIERLGGTSAVARMFNISPSSVSGWKQMGEDGRPKGIPSARMQFIALARPDVLKPSAEQQGSTKASH